MTGNSPGLLERFESVVERFGDKIAIDDGKAGWTYERLHGFAAGLSDKLQHMVSPGTPVGIALPNDARFHAAILACLAAGCPCMPLSTEASVSDLQIVIDEQMAAGTSSAGAINLRCERDSIANILYSSGTSGAGRKGVYQNQQNLLQDVTEYISAAGLSADDDLTQLYAPQAIGAWRDIFGALLTGATLRVIDLRTQGFGRLYDLLKRDCLTVVHTMPPVLRAFVRGLKSGERFESVRLIYAAGDRLFRTDLEAVWHHLPEQTAFYTGLGSTECSTLFRQWIITRDTLPETDVVPVGYAIAGRHSVVIAEDGRPAGPGEFGEIVVTSPHLALGYWANPTLTAQRFGRDHDGIPTFRTGDLGWESEDGLLHFVGRRDDNVKVRGALVSLAELEARLRTCRSVGDAAVLGYRTDRDQSIAAFVIPQERANANHIRTELGNQGRLISQIQVLDSFPLLPNGKRDIAQLRQRAEAANSYREDRLPEDVPKRIIERAWRSLPAGAYEPDLTWEQAGGDSLRALELLTRLEEATHLALSPEWFPNCMTPASLQAALEAASPDLPNRNLPPKSRLFIVPGVCGPSFALFELARKLSDICKPDLLRFPDPLDLRAQSFNELLQTTEAAILADQPEDLHLLGYSYGARFVFHLAARLQRTGCKIQTVILIDAPPEGESAVRHRHRDLSARVKAWMGHARNPALAGNTIAHRLAARLALQGIDLPASFLPIQSARLAAERVRLLTLNQQRLPRYDGHVYLLKSRDPLWQHCSPDFGWSRYASRLETVEIPASTHADAPACPEVPDAVKRILKTHLLS